MQVTLIGTVHAELGLCNAVELCRILASINPDVIFEEIRAVDHEEFYLDESKHTVEIKAIHAHLRSHSPKQVPVDDYNVPAGFRREVDHLLDFVEERSGEYVAMVSRINQLAFDHGYRFLSSSTHIEMRNAADDLLEQTVSVYGDDRIKNILSRWYFQLRKRETSMLHSIYAFCRSSPLESGVYLVGAGHMSYVVQSIEGRLGSESQHVSWRVWNG